MARRLQDAWSGHGPLACALWPLSVLYALVTATRRIGYRLGWLRSQAVAAPVIVVGNLVAGGAGKTPTVMAIIKVLRERGYTPGIVSRGYRGYRGHAALPLDISRTVSVAQCGDEALLMHLRTGAPVTVARDRVAAARQLLRRHPSVDIVVSDDGLQHLALARDVQVVVIDERGAGNGWLLPAGPLRETLPRVVGDRDLVLYNAASASTPLPGSFARRALAGAVPLRAWWQGQPASMDTLTALRGRPLLAAAGLARPQRFFNMLREKGLAITPLPLPDHHDYATLPWAAGTPDVIVTEKDAIKLEPERAGTTRIWVAPLDFAFDAAFEAALVDLLPPPGPRHGNSPAQPARLSDLQGPA